MTKILIRDGAVYSSDGWLQPGYVVIDDKKIFEVKAGDPPQSMNADEIIYAKDKAVIPGLLNNHTHLSQTFMRGLAGGRTLISWLKECIWPLQSEITPEELHLASVLGLVENIHCGVTHVVDHHKITKSPAHTDAVLEAVMSTGINFILARSWVDRGKNAEKPADIIDDLERLFDSWHQPQGLIQIASGPMATWRISEDTLTITHDLCKKYQAFTHIHVSETQDEVQMCLNDTQLRPVEWLDSIGLLDEHSQIVHAIWVEESEIRRLIESRSTIVHCPVSNAVLASGIAPLKKYIQDGALIRLGTDGSASADNQDLWEVIKSALLLSRASTLDASSIAPDDILKLAFSQDGLRKDSYANVTIVNLSHSRAAPVHNVASALVLCTHGCDVDTVIVRGKILLKNKEITFLNEGDLIRKCQAAVEKLGKRAGL